METDFVSYKMLQKVCIGVILLAKCTSALTLELPQQTILTKPMSTTEPKSSTVTISSNLPSQTLPPRLSNLTGPGPSSIYQCWSSFNSYRLPGLAQLINDTRSSIYNLSSQSERRTLYTLPYSELGTRYVNTSVPRTSLCDGRPRLLSALTTDMTLTYTNVSWTRVFAPTPSSRPKCTISESECTIVSSVWNKAASWSPDYPLSAYASFLNFPFSPFCTTTAKRCIPSTCKIYPERAATVFYWPTSIVSADACGERGSTITPTTTINGIPNTAMLGSTTLTSPTVYVIFSTVRVYSSKSMGKGESYEGLSTCGPSIPPRVTLSLNPRDVSSVRHYLTSSSNSYTFEPSSYTYAVMASSTLPFNFADMDVNHRPWDAYAGAFSDWEKQAWEGRADEIGTRWRRKSKTIGTMFAEYTPYLAVPGVVRDLGDGGEFLQCDVDTMIRDVTYIPIKGTRVIPQSTWLGSTLGSNAMETYVAPHVD